MLKIHLGKVDGMVKSANALFNNYVTQGWLDPPIIRELINDIDKTEVICGLALSSPVLGPISPRELSCGAKTCILMYYMPERIYNATACGDNCGKWMARIGQLHDVEICLSHIMKFATPEDQFIPFMNAVCVNNGWKIDTMRDFLECYWEGRRQGWVY